MKYEIIKSIYKGKHKGILIDNYNKIIFEGNYHSDIIESLNDIICELIRRQK